MNPISFHTPVKRTLRAAPTASLMLAVASLCSYAHGQQTAKVELPDAPGYTAPGPSYSSSVRAVQPDGQVAAQPYQTTDTPGDGDGKQTKRILGIIPNFHSVSANEHLPPQSVHEKLTGALEDSFDYSSVLTPALLAAYGQATNATPEFHQGAAAYGRYFWHSFVDQSDENLWVEFIVPVVTHEDTRYYTLGHGGKEKRILYAMKHVVVTRNDAGNNTFNFGEVFGAGISSGISTLYYPSRERSFGDVGKQWGQSIGIDAATFAFKEFWPDINSHLFHTKDN
jgi:hypothetical protein